MQQSGFSDKPWLTPDPSRIPSRHRMVRQAQFPVIADIPIIK